MGPSPSELESLSASDAPMDEALHARCVFFHERLVAHPLAWAFLEPVDPVALNLPTYLEIITSPMDLSSMWSKLLGREYATPAAYRSDLVLMFENAITFNSDDTHEDSVGYVHLRTHYRNECTHAQRADTS